eukprot:Rmarinus@m.28685
MHYLFLFVWATFWGLSWSDTKVLSMNGGLSDNISATEVHTYVCELSDTYDVIVRILSESVVTANITTSAGEEFGSLGIIETNPSSGISLASLDISSLDILPEINVQVSSQENAFYFIGLEAICPGLSGDSVCQGRGTCPGRHEPCSCNQGFSGVQCGAITAANGQTVNGGFDVVFPVTVGPGTSQVSLSITSAAARRRHLLESVGEDADVIKMQQRRFVGRLRGAYVPGTEKAIEETYNHRNLLQEATDGAYDLYIGENFVPTPSQEFHDSHLVLPYDEDGFASTTYAIGSSEESKTLYVFFSGPDRDFAYQFFGEAVVSSGSDDEFYETKLGRVIILLCIILLVMTIVYCILKKIAKKGPVNNRLKEMMKRNRPKTLRRTSATDKNSGTHVLSGNRESIRSKWKEDTVVGDEDELSPVHHHEPKSARHHHHHHGRIRSSSHHGHTQSLAAEEKKPSLGSGSERDVKSNSLAGAKRVKRSQNPKVLEAPSSERSKRSVSRRTHTTANASYSDVPYSDDDGFDDISSARRSRKMHRGKKASSMVQ